MNFYMKNNALLFKWSGKIVLTDSVNLIVCFSYFGPILGQSWPNLGPKWPNMTLSTLFLKFSCKICTQRMKLSDKVVLFTSLCCLIKNWLFGEISKLWGPKSPRDVRKHTLKIISWTFLIHRYWKLALLLLG